MQNEQLRQTQVELETSRDRYLDLYDNAPVGYLTVQLDGTVLESNRSAQKMLGLPPAELRGHAFAELLELEDKSRFLKAFDRVAGLNGNVATQAIEAIEASLAGFGERHRVAIQMALVRDQDQLVCRLALIDVTDRTRMQESSARLAAIVSSSEDAIVSRDLAGRVTTWNEAATHLFGYTDKDMLGRRLDRIVPDHRRDEETQLMRRLRAGEKIANVETERQNIAGQLVPLSIALSPIRSPGGQVIGSAMIARDISERHRADRALHRRLRQLDVLSEAGHALIMGDEDLDSIRRDLLSLVCTAVSSEICLDYALGESPGEFVLRSSKGLSGDGLATMSAQTGEGSLCALAARRGETVIINRLDPSAIPEGGALAQVGARCCAAFPLVAQGRLHGVAVFASTTRWLFHEGDLRIMRVVCEQVSAMMERARLVDDLKQREESLRRSDRAKDDFIATLAHELRNPMAPIRNAVSILRFSDNPKQLEWCRDVIERQVAQMTHLLEDLLDVSRVNRNRVELRRDRVELGTAIEQAVETAQPLVAAKAHRLSVELPEEPVVVDGDLTRLVQVFANLLNNAAKYTRQGGMITVTLRREGNEGVVSVRDTGIGLAPDHVEHIFDMFSRLAPALDQTTGGLGIGLALSRGLVELHGGRIEARSAGVGEGSEFLVRLPALPAQRPSAEQRKPQRPMATSAGAHTGARLLVVDDNMDAANMLAAALRLHGQDVRTAYDGEEALRLLADWHPDAALLDIGMRGLNGFELCERIRASGGPLPVLIACTGWGQEEYRERGRAAGFDHHLIKPVEPDAVLHLIARHRQGAALH